MRTTRNQTRGFPGVLIYLLLGSLKGGTKLGYGTGIVTERLKVGAFRTICDSIWKPVVKRDLKGEDKSHLATGILASSWRGPCDVGWCGSAGSL